MKKTTYIVIALFAIVAMVFAGRCVYQVLSISSTVPAIKEYNFNGHFLMLDKAFKNLVFSHPEMRFAVTDTVGNSEIGFGYEFTIYTKSEMKDFEYNLKFYEDKPLSKLEIIGAFNITDTIGGYGIKANGMTKLLSKFDSDILIPLEKQQNIKLIPIPIND